MKTRRQGLLLLLPCAIALLLLFALPQVLMLEASLGRRSAYGGIVHDWGLLNYARALEPLYLKILARSLWLAFATTALSLLVGYPVAYWIALRAPWWLRIRRAGCSSDRR